MDTIKTKIFIFLFFVGVFQVHAQNVISSLPQLKVWLRADTLTTLNPDSTISSWKDAKGGYDFTPSSGAVAPLVKKDVSKLNYHEYANFSGTKQLLSQAVVKLKNNKTTILIVGQLNAASSYGHWVCYGTNGGGSWNLREVGNSGRLSLTDGGTNLGAGVNPGNGQPAGNTTVLSANPAVVMATITQSANSFDIFENFINKHQYTAPFTQAASNFLSIGYRADAGLNANFKLAELMIFDSTLSVSQFNTVKQYLQLRYSNKVQLGPDINIAYGHCDTTLKVTDPIFKSFLWSTGDTTSFIAVNKKGNYWVDATDIYGFHSIDTVNVSYPLKAYTGNTTICGGSTNIWDTHLPKNGYVFKWQDNSTDSLFAITTSGKYYVKVTDTLGCSVVSDTVNIKMDTLVTSVSLGPDTTFCAGEKIGLKKGAGIVTSYLWSTGSTATTIPVTVSGKYWVTVKNSNNCSYTDTINIIISGQAPTPDFSFANTCLNNTTAFTDLSTPPSGETINDWSWNFGDLSSSILQNPKHKYADTTSYVVKLTIKTVAGCSNNITKTVKIYPQPKVSYTVANPFKNQATTFAGQAVTAYAISAWSWNFGDPSSGGSNVSALQNPNHTYTNIGSYTVKLIATTTKGCADTLGKDIVIETKINLNPISQLKLWLRADTLVTLYPDSTVNTWKDIVKGVTFTATSSSNGPRLMGNISLMNNKPYANFNGIAQNLSSQSQVALKNNFTTVVLIGQLNGKTSFGHLVCYGINSNGNWNLREVNNSGRLSFINASDNAGAGVDGSGNPTGTTTVLDKNPTAIMATVNPASSQWSLFEKFINRSTGTSTAFTQSSSNNVHLGYRPDAGLYANFKMAELLVFDSTLSATNMQDLKNYLQNRYSKLVNLGSDITVPYGFCKTTLTVSDPKFDTYAWSTGETTKSIAVNKPGMYWVDVTDIYGFHSIDTINILSPSINTVSNSTICAGSSLVWDTHLPKKGYTFKWQDNSTDSLFMITSPGKYYVKVTDSLGCFVVSDTITIKMDNIANSISLGADTTLCFGEVIGLKTGANLATSYLWSTGATTSTIPVTTSGKYGVTVKSVNNCSATDTVQVTVSGVAPTADFSFVNECLKNNTVFTDLSVPPSGQTISSWSWNFGDLKTSLTQHPVHMYADTGIYNVTLKVKTSGCESSLTKQVHIYTKPKVDFSSVDFYRNYPTVFKGKVTTTGYSIASWTWNFGDPGSGGNNTSTLQNPTHTYSAVGTFTVQLIGQTTNGCRDTIIKMVEITDKPMLTGLPQLKVWLRADTLVTLNPDSTISSWKDIRGGYNFASPSQPQSPLLKANLATLNNLPYANFNGANGMLSQTAVKLKNKKTTVIVVGQLNVATNYGYWLCYGVSAMGNWELFEVKNSGRLAFVHCGDNLGAGIDASGNGGGGPAGNTIALDKNPAFVMGTVDPTISQWTINENFVNKHTAFSGPYTQATSALMSLGYRTDVFNYGNFKMAELMVFDSTISTAQLDDIKTYLQKRYSQKVSLGPDIKVSYGFCNSTLNISNPLFKSFKWSTGDTTNFISIHKSGLYSVDATDIYGFHSTDTVKVDYPAISSVGNAAICKGNSLVWNTNLSKKAYTFKWQDNSTDSLITITQPGKYFVTIKDSLGCSITSDTATISYDDIKNEISLGIDTTLCSGNTIGLVKGANKVKSYLWADGSTTPTIPITTSGQYWLMVKSFNNCQAFDTVNIVISGTAPTSDFSLSPVCLKKTMAFTDLSFPPSGESIVSWLWDFGDGATSTSINPTHTYADTGKYTVKLKVTATSGCVATTVKFATVYPRPKMNFTSTGSTCERANIAFTDQSNLNGAPLSQWNWDFGDPASGVLNTSMLQNPSHQFNKGGAYTVTLIGVNDKGCRDTVSKVIDIKPSLKTDFSFTLACKDDTVGFKDLTVVSPGVMLTSSYWNFLTGTSTLLNPKNVFPASVPYNVTHIVTASNGCKDTVVKKVDVHASPVARFTNTTACVGGSTVFTDQSIVSSGVINGWDWTFENTKHATVKNPDFSFAKSGNSIVKQVVISDFGCKDSALKTIVVYPKPTAQFTATPEYGNPGQSVKFTNNSVNALTYIWDFDDKSSSTLASPAHIYKDTGVYHPLLVAVSTYGCKDSVKSTITILKRYIDVAITGATAQIHNGSGILLNDYLSVKVNLINKSTADIFTVDFYMETNDGPGVKETWTGKWLKGDAMNYEFKSGTNLKEGDHFVCVYALNPNGQTDEVLTDNKLCTAIDETEFKVLTPYPNPTEDFLVIPMIIPSQGDLVITLYDSQGQSVEIPFSGNVEKGLQFITIDTQRLTSGLYVCKAELDGKKIITKFFKK